VDADFLAGAVEHGHQLETPDLFRPPGAQHASRCRACTAWWTVHRQFRITATGAFRGGGQALVSTQADVDESDPACG
jgi:hypothetical protein